MYQDVPARSAGPQTDVNMALTTGVFTGFATEHHKTTPSSQRTPWQITMTQEHGTYEALARRIEF